MGASQGECHHDAQNGYAEENQGPKALHQDFHTFLYLNPYRTLYTAVYHPVHCSAYNPFSRSASAITFMAP